MCIGTGYYNRCVFGRRGAFDGFVRGREKKFDNNTKIYDVISIRGRAAEPGSAGSVCVVYNIFFNNNTVHIIAECIKKYYRWVPIASRVFCDRLL